MVVKNSLYFLASLLLYSLVLNVLYFGVGINKKGNCKNYLNVSLKLCEINPFTKW